MQEEEKLSKILKDVEIDCYRAAFFNEEQNPYDREPYPFTCPSCSNLDLKLRTEYSMVTYPVDFIKGRLVVDTDSGRVEIGIDDGEELTLFCDSCGEVFEYDKRNWIEFINEVKHNGEVIYKQGESE